MISKMKTLKLKISFSLMIFLTIFAFYFEAPTVLADRSNPIPIVINLEDYTFYPAVIFMSSMCENANEETFYKIYCLTPPEFTQDSKEKFLILKQKYTNCDIEFIDMGNACEDWCIPGCRWGKESYYRLLIPDLLPPTCEKCIYLDTDILVEQDLTPLYNQDLHGNLIGAIPDQWRDAPKIKHAFLTGLEDTSKYVQSGVILWDLKACREFGIVDKFFEYFRFASANGGATDMAAINVVCYGKVQDLPMKYNAIVTFGFSFCDYDSWRFKSIYSLENFEEARTQPVILHFAGTKPWKEPATPFADKWWQCALKTPFWRDIWRKYFNVLKYEERQAVKQHVSFHN